MSVTVCGTQFQVRCDTINPDGSQCQNRANSDITADSAVANAEKLGFEHSYVDNKSTCCSCLARIAKKEKESQAAVRGKQPALVPA